MTCLWLNDISKKMANKIFGQRELVWVFVFQQKAFSGPLYTCNFYRKLTTMYIFNIPNRRCKYKQRLNRVCA